MTKILLVTSSPRGDASYSTKVARELAAKLKAAQPDAQLVERDLVAKPLPHIVPEYTTGIYTPADKRNSEQAKVVALSDVIVDELMAADTIILATGFINFSISSTMKSWIDHITRSGRTFSYDANGHSGHVSGKKVYVVLASGGVYSEGPAAAVDFATPYMKHMLGFNGMTDVEFVRVEGVNIGGETLEASIEKANAQVDAIVRNAAPKSLAA